MLYREFLPLLSLLFACLTTNAAVFVVTSNADAGVGTLREALTLAAANGSASKDYINFNIGDVSEAGRTIILSSQLPDVSSNLVIDGGTQPGLSFGVSDAKVALFYQTPITQSLSGLKIVNEQDVEIYGLYIKFLTNTQPSATTLRWIGIDLKNDKNIQIGAQGKGNVVAGFAYPITVNFPDNTDVFFENLTLKDNFFGVDADGETFSTNTVFEAQLYSIIGQVNIGGAPTEGNLFPQGLTFHQINYSNSTNPADRYISSPAVFKIQNNKICVDYNVSKTITGSKGLIIGTSNPGGKNTCYIEDNVIANQNGASPIFILNNGGQVNIVRNYIGIDKTLTTRLPIGAFGIYVFWSDLVNIGSSNPLDANYITGCKPVYISNYATASVNKNSFFCTVNEYPMVQNGSTRPVTQVSILSVTATSIGGTATPNSSIELFYSDNCGTCSPETYFASVMADNIGNWTYNGPINGDVIASATINNSTSEFTRTSIDVTAVKTTNACNGLGSIIGAVPKSASKIKWIDANRNVVGTSADLLNVPVGKYKLLAQNGVCGDSTSYFEIKNRFQLATNAIQVVNPSCGNANGGISGLQITNNDNSTPTLSWKDANGTQRSQTVNLSNVPEGVYTLSISSADKACIQTYGPITLTNTSGPNINQAAALITGSNCGTTTGSITGIVATGTGTLTYSWKNSQQQVVGIAADLLNQPTDQYILTVTDQSTCGPVSSTVITIPELNAVSIDASAKVQTPASCQNNDGTITGIKVTGATTYKWINGTGQTVSTQPDLAGAAPGSYYLQASNSTCNAQTAVYTITRQTNTTDYGGTTKVLNNATCGLNNGSIEVIFENPVNGLPVSYRWENSLGQTVGGNSRTLSNIDAGTYKLYGTDANGCEKFVVSYSIGRVPALTVVTNTVKLTDDHCQTGTGSIKGIGWTGKAPVSVTWTDGSGTFIANTTDLTNLKAGTYNVKIADGSGCTQALSYTINNMDIAVPSPSVNPVQLCRTGAALIAVNNPSPLYVFKLYDKITDVTPIDQSTSGNFKVSVSANRSYFISQYTGTCESGRTEVTVSVGLTAIDIANTITPNGDGNNDIWKIKGIESYPNALVQIFNRNGQIVYDAKGYTTPFDGKFNGQPLPAGAYYYIINLNTNCGLISGSISILR